MVPRHCRRDNSHPSPPSPGHPTAHCTPPPPSPSLCSTRGAWPCSCGRPPPTVALVCARLCERPSAGLETRPQHCHTFGAPWPEQGGTEGSHRSKGGGQETHCATVWLINPKQGDNGGGTQWQEMGQIVSILVLSPTKYSFSVRHKLDIVSLFGGAEIIQFSTTQIIFKFGMCFPNVSFREIANCEGSLLGSVKSFLLAQ